MMKFGQAPYLECSSLGDHRFSAFFASPSCVGGLSIEDAYQGAKVFPDGTTGLGWRAAKGRQAVNMDDCVALYDALWLEWVEEQDLLPVLKAASGLSDIFGQPGRVCQAEVLWRIRNGELQGL